MLRCRNYRIVHAQQPLEGNTPIFAFLCVFKLSKVSCETETRLETRVNGVLHFPPAISRPNQQLPLFSKRWRSRYREREPSEAILSPWSVFVLLRLPYFSVLSLSPGMALKSSAGRSAPTSPPCRSLCKQNYQLSFQIGSALGAHLHIAAPCQPAQAAALAGQMQRYGCGREARGPPYKNVLGAGVYSTQSALRA